MKDLSPKKYSRFIMWLPFRDMNIIICNLWGLMFQYFVKLWKSWCWLLASKLESCHPMHTLNTTLILVKVALLHLSVLEAPCGRYGHSENLTESVWTLYSLSIRFLSSRLLSSLQLHHHRTHLDFSQQSKTLTVYSCATLINTTEKSSN